MDSRPYPFGRTVLYVVPGSSPRVFRTKAAAMAVLTDQGGERVCEFVEDDHEFVLAFLHDRDGETAVMDMTKTDAGVAAAYFPDVTALAFDRYGSLDRFVRNLEEFRAFWLRVQESGLRAASMAMEGRAERAFVDALRVIGSKLAYETGGLVALEELDELLTSFDGI